MIRIYIKTFSAHIAFAQSYFAVQTRKAEIIEERLNHLSRIETRERLRASEKQLSQNIYERGVDDKGFGRIRSKGDTALFGGHTTEDMKKRLGIKDNRPLADFLPTLTIAAKNLATEMTNYNVEKANLYGEGSITREHIQNNTSVREMLGKRGIKPEELSYVNAHGTGTAKNDEAEFLSLHTIFDDVNDDLSVSSTKAMVGHCLGAAGAIEAVYAIKALTEGKIPPTIGYSDEDLEALKDKAGKIDFMPNKMREKEMNYVMSNSFAFGGSNASIVFSKKEGKVTETENDEKIYITGKGRCNFTNACDIEDFFKNVVSNPKFLYSSLYYYKFKV